MLFLSNPQKLVLHGTTSLLSKNHALIRDRTCVLLSSTLYNISYHGAIFILFIYTNIRVGPSTIQLLIQYTDLTKAKQWIWIYILNLQWQVVSNLAKFCIDLHITFEIHIGKMQFINSLKWKNYTLYKNSPTIAHSS